MDTMRFRSYLWTIVKLLPLGVMLPLVILGASIGPEEAASNLAKWARWLGFTNLPEWINQKAADNNIIIAAALLALVYLIVVFVVPRITTIFMRRGVSSLILTIFFFIGGITWYYIGNISVDRHISATQRAEIRDALLPHATEFSIPIMVSSADAPEPNGYAIEIMMALSNAGLPVASTSPNFMSPMPMRALTPRIRGVFFQVKTRDHPPEQVVMLREALARAQMSSRLALNTSLGDDSYILTIGLR
jgi:hypothetical protein